MPTVTKQSKMGGKTTGVIGRIKPVSLKDDGIKINLYGKSGTGKTTLACSFPKKVLIIGFEDGTKSVHNVKGVEFVLLKESAELAEVIKYVNDHDEYRTVVCDTASGLQDMVLKEILELDELPAQRSWGMAKQQQWGQCALQTKERLRSLLKLNINVIIVAQERDFNAEGNDDNLLMPYVASALSPSVVGWLNPACDYICQTFIRNEVKQEKVKVGTKVKVLQRKTGKVEYCLRTYPDPVYTTKFRIPKGSVLPEVVVDPDFDKILSIIKGEYRA